MRRKYYGSNLLFVILCLHNKVNGIDDNNNKSELKRFRRLRQTNDQQFNNEDKKSATIEAEANYHHHHITTTLLEIDNMNVQSKSADNTMENRITKEDDNKGNNNPQPQQQQRQSSTTINNDFVDTKTRSTNIVNHYNNLDGILSSGSSSISDRLHKLLHVESDHDRIELDRFLQESHEMSMSMSLLYF